MTNHWVANWTVFSFSTSLTLMCDCSLDEFSTALCFHTVKWKIRLHQSCLFNKMYNRCYRSQFLNFENSMKLKHRTWTVLLPIQNEMKSLKMCPWERQMKKDQILFSPLIKYSLEYHWQSICSLCPFDRSSDI